MPERDKLRCKAGLTVFQQKRFELDRPFRPFAIVNEHRIMRADEIASSRYADRISAPAARGRAVPVASTP